VDSRLEHLQPYDYQKRPVLSGVILAIVVCDLCAAVFLVANWSWLAAYMAEPLGWATQHVLPPRPELGEWPCTILWVWPIVTAVASAVAHQLKLLNTAFWIALFPLLYTASVAVLFTVLPATLR
jgi:predicted tellurium resistance membrane protein TerC